MSHWTNSNCMRLLRPTAIDNKGARMFGITVSDIFYVLEHACFSSLWLESTWIIVYANVGMRTTGIFVVLLTIQNYPELRNFRIAPCGRLHKCEAIDY